MKTRGKLRNYTIAAIALLCICLATCSYALSQYTLAGFFIPSMYAAALSLLSGVVMWKWGIWRWLTRSEKFLPNYMVHSVCTGILGLSLFYICNYAFANDKNGKTRNCVVEKKFTRVRHKSRRVGRNRYTQGEAYSVYYIKIRLENGLTKELQTERNRYAGLHRGDTLKLPVSDGLFGIPVIKYNRMAKYTNRSSYRRQFGK